MARIQQLNDDLVNKIAAGEVVERPASVVKELVENSLDADSKQITIDIREGGQKSIRVQDDGAGIHPSDLPLSLSRHATSKIAESNDLFTIDTMGFRGEALAAISSVSRLTIQSRREADESGSKLEVSESEDPQSTELASRFRISDIGNCTPGTTVEIRDLFHNIPARKAFLKKPIRDYSQILQLIQALALANPHVGFRLIHNGKETLNLPGVKASQAINDRDTVFKGEEVLRQRMTQIMGREMAENALYCCCEDDLVHFEALISPPGFERGNSKHIFTFVNNRWVTDKLLRYGIIRGYHSHLLKGRFPICVGYLAIDPSLVDVNVHPSKSELRFQYDTHIQDAIAKTIRESLREGSWSGLQQKPMTGAISFDTSGAEAIQEIESSFESTSPPPAAPYEKAIMLDPPASTTSDLQPSRKPPTPATSINTSAPVRVQSMLFEGTTEPSFATPENTATPVTSQPITTWQWHDLKFLGSFASGYLFFESPNQLLVVDQHAFHERILYERFKRDLSNLGGSQKLLIPELIELPTEEVSSLLENRDSLDELGFILKPINEHSIELQGLPSLLSKSDPITLLTELSESLDNGVESAHELSASHHVLSTLACHAAVRQGESLDEALARKLLKEADGVDFIHNCPHGRRVFKVFQRSEVERWFDR